jgi:oxygen-independent coproporphyrinogen-3 oxidase
MMISPETFERYAAMRVPRYTSYPTAPHFSAAVDETQYRSWLRSLPADEPVSVYLHIPFCREMCWYCGCHTTVTRRRAPVSRNASSIAREIELVATAIGGKLTIGHLHWGGGSPTLLTPDDVALIRDALKQRFVLDPRAECAVEIDPRTLTAELASAFARAGVNRASLGVQTFDAKVQAAINRMQSFETTAAAVRTLRERGIPAINFDLVYGLPFQTVQSCLDTIEQVLKLQPDRLAVFGYAHVPEFKRHQRKIDEKALPGTAERQEQANAIARALTAWGYRQVGLDHFALPGDSLVAAEESGMLHRNFQGYTTDPCRTLIGLGVSAIGRLPNGFVQNATRIPDYERRIAAGSLATVRGYALTPDDRRRASIIEQLMCDYRADVSGIDAPLEQFESEGLVRRHGNVIEIVEDARPLVRAVAAAFDAKLAGSTARHVTAV